MSNSLPFHTYMYISFFSEHTVFGVCCSFLFCLRCVWILLVLCRHERKGDRFSVVWIVGKRIELKVISYRKSAYAITKTRFSLNTTNYQYRFWVVDSVTKTVLVSFFCDSVCSVDFSFYLLIFVGVRRHTHRKNVVFHSNGVHISIIRLSTLRSRN